MLTLSRVIRSHLAIIAAAITLATGPVPLSALDVLSVPPRSAFPFPDSLPRGATTQVAENSQGILFVSAHGELLEYDGEHVFQHHVSDISSISAVAVDAYDRVYIGLNESFGYLDGEAEGGLYFRTLDHDFREDQSPEGLGIRQIVPTREGIILTTPKAAYIWNPGQGRRLFESSDFVQGVFTLGEVVYLATSREGLFRFEDGGFVSVKSSPRLEDGTFAPLLAFAPTGLTEFLLHSPEIGFFRFDGVNFDYLEPPGWFTPGPVQDRRLQLFSHNSEIIVASTKGEIFIVDRDLNLLRHLLMESGRGAHAGEAVHLDSRKGLWVRHGAELSRIDLASPYSFLDLRSVFPSSNTITVSYQDARLYLSDETSTFVADVDSRGTLRDCHILELINGEEALPESDKPLLLSAPEGKVVEAYKQGLRPVYDLPVPFTVVEQVARSRFHPQRVHVLSRSAIFLLEHVAGTYRVARQIDLPKGFAHQVVEAGPRELWIETGFGSTARILLPEESAEGAQDQPEVSLFGTSHGLPLDEWISPELLGDQVIFRANRAVYAFEPTLEQFVMDAVSFANVPMPQPRIRHSSDAGSGRIWVASFERLGLLSPSEEGAPRWEPLPPPPVSLFSMREVATDDRGRIWVSLDNSILFFDPTVQIEKEPLASPVIRRITCTEHDHIFYHAHGSYEPTLRSLTHGESALRVLYAVPQVDGNQRIEYQTRMSGVDSDWTTWKPEGRREFSYLSGGSYRLEIRARLPGQEPTPSTVLLLSVAPHWYATAWAQAGFVLLAIGLVSLIVLLRSRALTAKNRRLRALIDHHTAEVRKQARLVESKNGELHRLVDSLNDSNAKLQQANQDKNEFIGIASHDLKNPLASIISLAAAILEHPACRAEEDLATHARDIKGCADAMYYIITNLLDINRIEEGLLVVKREPADLAEALFGVCQSYQRAARNKEISLEYLGPPQGIVALGQKEHFRQIFDNLVSNAIKYTPHGKRVVVRVHGSKDRATVEVEDEGPGISREDQGRLYEKFARLSAKPTAGESSTGLGLAIVKRMTDALGGSIHCDSELGRGTRFIVSFQMSGQPNGHPKAALA